MGILAAEPAKLENHLVLHIPSCWLLLLEPQKCALLQRQWSLGRLHHTNRVEPLVLEIARKFTACARPHAQKYPDRLVYFRIFSSCSWHLWLLLLRQRSLPRSIRSARSTDASTCIVELAESCRC